MALSFIWSGSAGVEAGRTLHYREELHGVLSRQRLTPLLRSPARQVRFSPDGAYILVQDEAGVYVLSREPLAFRFWVSAPEVPQARFSAESKTLVIASAAPGVERWDLAGGKKIEQKTLSVPDGCLMVALSPNGETLACYSPDFNLRLFDTMSGALLFEEKLNAPPTDRMLFIVPRERETALAEPFGYLTADSPKPFGGRSIFRMPLYFSPDGRFLVAGEERRQAIAVDAKERKKIGLPGAFHHRLDAALCFVSADRVVALDREKEGNSALVAFPDGRTLERLQIKASGVTQTTNPRYLLLHLPGSEEIQVFDLEQKKIVETPLKIEQDIWGDLVAAYSEEGDLGLYHFGESSPFAKVTLPLDPLPTLRTAGVSPDLQGLVLGIRGRAAVYRVASGERIGSSGRFEGAWFENEEMLHILSVLPDRVSAAIRTFDLRARGMTDSWSLESDKKTPQLPGQVHLSGPVLLEMTGGTPLFLTLGAGSPIPTILLGAGVMKLSARDLRSGNLVWSHKFQGEGPVPFADPQGDRLVLAWKAKSAEARSAAKPFPEAAARLKVAKLSDLDTFFEVLNARTGKTVGGALVQSGGEGKRFPSVFSVGDSLILWEKGSQITLFSLSTGGELARLFGGAPAASAEAGLLCASEAERLSLYDLKTGAKRDTYVFPDAVVYVHFSADGTGLFVLTEHEWAYVLDLKGAPAQSGAVKP